MNDDKRRQTRYAKEEVIFVEVLSASGRSRGDNVMLECTTKDISIGGLKIRAEYQFLLGAILELLISFESGGYKFLLTATVKWLEKVSDTEYLAGFEIVESEHSDFVVWRNMFAELESQKPEL